MLDPEGSFRVEAQEKAYFSMFRKPNGTPRGESQLIDIVFPTPLARALLVGPRMVDKHDVGLKQTGLIGLSLLSGVMLRLDNSQTRDRMASDWGDEGDP